MSCMSSKDNRMTLTNIETLIRKWAISDVELNYAIVSVILEKRCGRKKDISQISHADLLNWSMNRYEDNQLHTHKELIEMVACDYGLPK